MCIITEQLDCWCSLPLSLTPSHPLSLKLHLWPWTDFFQIFSQTSHIWPPTMHELICVLLFLDKNDSRFTHKKRYLIYFCAPKVIWCLEKWNLGVVDGGSARISFFGYVISYVQAFFFKSLISILICILSGMCFFIIICLFLDDKP